MTADAPGADGRETLGGLLSWASSALGASDSRRLDAEILLATAAGCTRAAVIAFPERPVAETSAARFRAWVGRRAGGEPLAYLTGEREFYGLSLSITADVLVPRPETELLVDAVIARVDEDRIDGVLDLGTGSGAVALAIKAERPGVDVTATDIDESALAIARGNAAGLGLEIEMLRSNWYSALAGRRFDCIVVNPPYVASGDPHFDGPLGHEPRIALDGGRDGLGCIRVIVDGAGEHLARRGCLVLEHGYDQREAVVDLFRGRSFEIVGADNDLGGRPRLIVARRR